MKELFRTAVFISLIGASVVLLVQIMVDVVDTYLAAKQDRDGRYE